MWLGKRASIADASAVVKCIFDGDGDFGAYDEVTEGDEKAGNAVKRCEYGVGLRMAGARV